MVKELQTRIALKYDSYTNWNDTAVEGKGGNLVLLPGEIGICEIPAVQDGVSNVAPTVLFKVGGSKYPDTEANQQLNRVGKLMAFKDLPWASAKAADVYSWAKADSVVFDTASKTIQFKAGDAVVHSIDLSHFAAASTVADHTTSIADFSTRIAAIESSIGLGDGTEEGSVASQIADILEELGKITGADTVEGSIAKALKDAKAYADGTQAAAETAAKDYTDGKVATLNAKDAELAQEDARLAGLITEETNARAALEAKIGTVGEDDTVISLIAAAKQEGTEAKSAVAALTAEGGAVAVNTEAIAGHDATIAANTENISKNTQAIAAEVKARGEADTALDTRLATVEGEINAFFKDAAKDEGEGENLKNALDTLVEIQQYLSGEGEATSGLMASVNKNATDIQGLDSRVTANAGDIAELQTLTGGHTTAIGKAQADAEAAAGAAEAAQNAADNAQADINAIEEILNGTEAEGDVPVVPGLISDVATNAANISGLAGRMETAEGAIDALEAIVTGDNTNDKLREAISALEETVNTGANNNQALRDEISRVAGLVDNETTGLGATNATATANASRLAVIEADYLTSTDLLIFNCGSATSVDHSR